MEIEKQILKGEVLEIVIKGDLDAASAIQLDEVIKESLAGNYRKIMFNCHDLNYISSAGLGVFVSYIDQINTLKGKMVLFGMDPKIFNVFKILGLHQIMTIVEDKNIAEFILNEG